MNRKSKVALSVLLCATTSVAIAGVFPATKPQGKLGTIYVNPYGNSPLTAIIDLGSNTISDVSVMVKGKGRNGVDISYDVGMQNILTSDGIPVFGLYADHNNQVEVSYLKDGQKIEETYSIMTNPVSSQSIDTNNVTRIPTAEVKKIASGFEDRLYMVNSHTYLTDGSKITWAARKPPGAPKIEGALAGGSAAFEAEPQTYIVDTNGDIRWWLNSEAVFDAESWDLADRGYFMGFNDTGKGSYTFVQGSTFGTFNLLGKVEQKRLPRGYVDASHEMLRGDNGNFFIRVAKRDYMNDVGDQVITVRDQILELDEFDNVVDRWDLNVIFDPYRDALLSALDIGAVCVNVDLDAAGQTMDMDELKKIAYGDTPGVGAGRNWAHVNSIEYDASDDSIILSFRHQGVAKVTRDKQVKWILAPREGWNDELSQKLLTPVDIDGKPIKCTDKGVCEDDFDFTYTQHTAWLNKSNGNVTVFDNGDGRGHDQPAIPTMKYSRFVEYKVNEQDMTVQQTWEYGKERGYDWYSPITSNVEFAEDKNTMFGFGGSVHLYNRGERTIGKINEIDYDSKEVKVEIDVLSAKNNNTHYRARIVDLNSQFGF
ncbi:aryl-sulfate sulfotransferase [Ferrimonas pelagia]|uniref:Aryl-sulfate sulfotransferase n=1 Tax=Ferrimonas pelagia TaxID=1177826 RepID=A0ABP9ETV7_9GAMM